MVTEEDGTLEADGDEQQQELALEASPSGRGRITVVSVPTHAAHWLAYSDWVEAWAMGRLQAGHVPK